LIRASVLKVRGSASVLFGVALFATSRGRPVLL
jgi:hypothetical protein